MKNMIGSTKSLRNVQLNVPEQFVMNQKKKIYQHYSNLEQSNQKKSSVRNILTANGNKQ